MAIKNKRRRIEDNAHGIFDKVRTGTRSAVERVQHDFDVVKDETQHYIRKKPFSSVAVAAGIGALVGAGVALGISTAVAHRRKSVIDRLFDWF